MRFGTVLNYTFKLKIKLLINEVEAISLRAFELVADLMT